MFIYALINTIFPFCFHLRVDFTIQASMFVIFFTLSGTDQYIVSNEFSLCIWKLLFFGILTVLPHSVYLIICVI